MWLFIKSTLTGYKKKADVSDGFVLASIHILSSEPNHLTHNVLVWQIGINLILSQKRNRSLTVWTKPYGSVVRIHWRPSDSDACVSCTMSSAVNGSITFTSPDIKTLGPSSSSSLKACWEDWATERQRDLPKVSWWCKFPGKFGDAIRDADGIGRSAFSPEFSTDPTAFHLCIALPPKHQPQIGRDSHLSNTRTLDENNRYLFGACQLSVWLPSCGQGSCPRGCWRTG